MTTSPNKSAERQAVEDELRRAGPVGLSNYALAERTGIAVQKVRQVVDNMISNGKAKRVNAGTKHAATVLLSELAKAEATQREARQTPLRNSTTGKDYVPLELAPFAGRPGAMDAFALPSVVGGVRTQPQKPMSMCTGPAVRAMALGGGWRFAE